MEVLPAIIEDAFPEMEKKLKLIAPLVDWVQVDVCDGEFVTRTTWTRVEDLASAPEDLHIDLHCMAHDPLAYVRRAVKIPQVKRITFHYEATAGHIMVIQAIKDAGRDAGIALNPGTAIGAAASLLPSLDAVLVMVVNPGWGGQALLPDTPARVTALKTMSRGVPVQVGVDGGIHLATGSAQACVDAGADYLVVGSDIFKSEDPAMTIRQLRGLTPQNPKP